MPSNFNYIFPQDFLNKLINFPKESLINLFRLCQKSTIIFKDKEFNSLDPLVCENACHIRAFTLWHIYNKHQYKWNTLNSIIQSLQEIIETISLLPTINEHTNQTIGEYLQKHNLYLKLNEDLIFDIKFIFFSYLLTLTKKKLPSDNFMLHEKTCLEFLKDLGLVQSKIKLLVSSAQKELSAMSCFFIQKHYISLNNEAFNQLLLVRYDNHKRSYLPQYLTAKIILLNTLQNNIPIIIKISRFNNSRYYDELVLGFVPSENKKKFINIGEIKNSSQTAIICKGVINYSGTIETPKAYLKRLGNYSLLESPIS